MDDYQSLFQRVSLQLSRGSNDMLGGSTSAHSPYNISQDTAVSDCAIQMAACSRLNELSNSEKPTVDRVVSFIHDEDPSLVELLFQFGRYLLISCSRPGTQIANLQGIWSNDTEPPWEYVLTTYLVLLCSLLQFYIFLDTML
jgi:alpha-L-fucosidase 2